MKRKVFVVMPFRDDTEDLWTLGILPAAEALGWECSRADTDVSQGFLVSHIYKEISESDVIIGEMTGQNPNVFYEIGVAHALGKPTLLLARSGEDLTAFDTRGFHHGFHSSRISKANLIVSSFLSNVDLGEIYEPSIPGARTIYQWPLDDIEDPIFTWDPKRKDDRFDVNGGQSIMNRPPIGRIICVRKTDRNWNWRRGGSIMKLVPRTREIGLGDIVFLSLVFRTELPVTFGFIGDGGEMAVEGKQKPDWSRSWKDTEFRAKEAPFWQSKMLRVVVEPTIAGYDPKKRGTAILLTSRTGGGEAEIRKVRVIQVRKAANSES
ncbi:MAG TPA: hypothetical protein VGS07_34145 [Thermoanaerobaculia bacterium]|nr:hypothetical protein [Thermoanaerobaculia bacterium]